MNALSEETGVVFSKIANREDFLAGVRRGSWHHVLKTIQTSRFDVDVVQGVY